MAEYNHGTDATQRKLTEILSDGSDGGKSLHDAWAATETAADFGPLPAGQYITHAISGELTTSKHGTPGYKLTFLILEGDYAGRRIWHDIWLTAKAMAMAKRDLLKLGITASEQLKQPLPQGMRCECRITLRTSDSGNKYTDLRSFKVLRVDTLNDPDYPPPQSPLTNEVPPAAVAPAAAPDDEQGDTSFNPTDLEGGAA